MTVVCGCPHGTPYAPHQGYEGHLHSPHGEERGSLPFRPGKTRQDRLKVEKRARVREHASRSARMQRLGTAAQ